MSLFMSMLTFLAVLFVADQVRKMRFELVAELRRQGGPAVDESGD